MSPQKRVKSTDDRLRLVGVIMTPADLRLLKRMAEPPDLLEVRLDALVSQPGLEPRIRDLAVPLIITARHPQEGGENNLSSAARRDLLLRFLPVARYVDIELRSVRTHRTVLERARRIGVSTIISFHDLGSTPSLGSLRAKAARAARLRPALFKVATRTDSPQQLAELLRFVSSPGRRLAVAAMGIGKLGAASRILLAQCGSALVYTSLSGPRIEGQIPLQRFRAALHQVALT